MGHPGPLARLDTVRQPIRTNYRPELFPPLGSRHGFRNKSGNFAIFTPIRRA
jgi:hypothetical protein